MGLQAMQNNLIMPFPISIRKSNSRKSVLYSNNFWGLYVPLHKLATQNANLRGIKTVHELRSRTICFQMTKA